MTGLTALPKEGRGRLVDDVLAGGGATKDPLPTSRRVRLYRSGVRHISPRRILASRAPNPNAFVVGSGQPPCESIDEAMVIATAKRSAPTIAARAIAMFRPVRRPPRVRQSPGRVYQSHM